MLTLLPAEHWEYKVGDMVRGLATALGKGKSQDLKNALNIITLGSCIPTRSARSALVIAINALNLPPGANIGVPLYNCPVVIKAVKAAGCTPVFIDINSKTFCMSADDLASKASRLDAVIAVHMFGNLCDIPKLREAAQGKPIIEDCAQSIGSRFNGRMAGSFGTVSVFSFRSGKYLSVGEGGALFSTHAEMRCRLLSLIAEMPVPARADECVHVLKTYLRSMLRRRPLWGMVGYRLWSIYNGTVVFAAKTPIVASQIYKSDLAIALKRLSKLDSAIQKQRANADYYSRILELDPDMLCSEKPGTFYNRYLYPIVFPSMKDRDALADYLFNKKIGAIKPYQDIVEVAAEYYGYQGDCPVTERISKRLLVIPSNYSLREKEVQRIAQCVNAGWTEITSRDR